MRTVTTEAKTAELAFEALKTVKWIDEYSYIERASNFRHVEHHVEQRTTIISNS